MQSEHQEKKTLEWKKCNHHLELIKRNESRCSKCGCGYIGHDVEKLIKAANS